MIRRAAIFVVEPRLFHQDREVKTDRYADFLSQGPEGRPCVVIYGRARARGQNIYMTQPAPFRETLQLAARRIRILHRELRDADQALGLGSAKVAQPIIISLIAVPPQLRVGNRHRVGRTVHDRSVRAVAVHVGQTKICGGRTQLPFAHHAAALDRPHGAAALCGCVITMRAKGLTFPRPARAVFRFHHPRSAFSQSGRQALGPQVFRQPTQIDVVIGRDESVCHFICHKRSRYIRSVQFLLTPSCR